MISAVNPYFYSNNFPQLSWFNDTLKDNSLKLMTMMESHVHTVYNSCSDFVKQSMSVGGVAPFIGAVGAMSIAAYYYSNSSTKGYLKIDPLVSLTDQTIELSDQHDRALRICERNDNQLLRYMYEDAQTVYEAFRRGARESNNGDCMGYRKTMPDGSCPYVWIRFNDAIRRSENLARGFLLQGLAVGQQTFVGIYSTNRPEWILSEQACYFYSMVNVPLYDTLGLEACIFIIQQTNMRLLIIDKSLKAETLLAKHDEIQCLRSIVLMDQAEDSLTQIARKCGVELIQLEELERLGDASTDRIPSQPPTPEQWATICYTSGTTGLPKGAILTHANIMADCTSMGSLKYTPPNNTDTMISYLPLAHMFERMLETICYMVGGRVGFYRGDVRVLAEDLQELKPTVIPTVPRVLNRIYDKVMDDVSKSSLKKYLVDWAVAAKYEELKKQIIRSNSVWDKLVFSKVRNTVGGRVRLMITGSAPCNPEILTFIRAALGCVVVEGYGQTECVACATVSLEGDHIPGHVGPPIPCCKIKLVDVPEMNYFTKDNKGEVCIWGYNVFQGYYKDEERTKEALDSEGWLHTGDIGCWTKSGALLLIDRKKHIFKLSQGEYIAPEKIENVYSRSRFVAQCYVHGESLKSCLVGVVVPKVDFLVEFAGRELGLHASAEDLCKNKKIKKLILEDLQAEGKKAGIASFEQVKDIHLYPELFSVDNGLLTPTFKTKRPVLKEFFKEQISQMYRALV